MIVLPKKGDGVEITLSAAVMQQLGLKEGEAVQLEIHNGVAQFQPIATDDWLDMQNSDLPAWLKNPQAIAQLRQSLLWARENPARVSTPEELEKFL